YCSGYCLIDDRRQTAKAMMSFAKSSGCLVVLDAVVNMHQNEHFGTFSDLKHNLPDRGDISDRHIDVFVCELPELLTWMGVASTPGASELKMWELKHDHAV